MKTFIDTFSNRTFHHDVNGLGDEVIWMSERDGWNHLYLYDGHTGKVKNQITSGEWLVREVVQDNPDGLLVVFGSAPTADR